MTATAKPASEETRGLAPAGILGRVGKFMAGAFQLYAVYSLITHWSFLTGEAGKNQVILWIVAGLAFALFSWTVNLGFNRKWHNKPF